MMKYLIRDAIHDDLESIVRIYNSTIAGRMVTADTEEVTIESREKWFYEHSPNVRPIWVMEIDAKVVGWLSFQSFYGRPAYKATAEVSIYIDSDFRKLGLGNIFLEKAIGICPIIGINNLLGFIFGHNQPSVNLFVKFGFASWGNLPKVADLDGIERDLIIMGKRITNKQSSKF